MYASLELSLEINGAKTSVGLFPLRNVSICFGCGGDRTFEGYRMLKWITFHTYHPDNRCITTQNIVCKVDLQTTFKH